MTQHIYVFSQLFIVTNNFEIKLETKLSPNAVWVKKIYYKLLCWLLLITSCFCDVCSTSPHNHLVLVLYILQNDNFVGFVSDVSFVSAGA